MKHVALKLKSLVRLTIAIAMICYLISLHAVLPRFSVELSGPNRIERNDTKIRGMVSAE